MNKRLIIAIITGAVLGIICIVGAQLRYGGSLSAVYLSAFYFNRLLMGLVIGLCTSETTLQNRLIRGLVLGLIVSFAFYSATDFKDIAGFLVGGVYGVIIEFAAYKFVAAKPKE